MTKLLNAGFTRLKKDKFFWLLTLTSVAVALFFIVTQYLNKVKYNIEIQTEDLLKVYIVIIGIVIAVFSSFFIGTEYSDATIRNKLIIGHKRVNIYFSNLIIVITSGVFFQALFMAIIAAFGLPLFGGLTSPASTFLFTLFRMLMIIVAYSSIFTFISMTCSNRTVSCIACLLLIFAMLMAALLLFDIITTPEFIEKAEIINEQTGEFKIITERNSRYPSELKMLICQTLQKTSPAGQSFQMTLEMEENTKTLPLYSAVLSLVFTGAGAFLFKRKELK